MEATLNQEAILAMLVERLKELTRSIKNAKGIDELADIAQSLSATGDAAYKSLSQAAKEGSISLAKQIDSTAALNDALTGTALLLMLKAEELSEEEEDDNGT